MRTPHDALKETSERHRQQAEMRNPTKMTSFSDFIGDDRSTGVESTQPEDVQDSISYKHNEVHQRYRDVLSHPSHAAASVVQETVGGVFTSAREGRAAASARSYLEPISHITDANERIPKRPWTHEPTLRGFKQYLKADIIELANWLMRDEKSKDKRFHAVREVKKANIEYNCHGYTFTDGKGGWLTDADARRILEQNGYKKVASYDGEEYPNVQKLNIKKGDVVAYYSWPGQLEPSHTGVVSRVKGNQIFLKSKWGIFGLNEHPIDVVPKEYPKFWTIYHTDRPGGRLLQPDT